MEFTIRSAIPSGSVMECVQHYAKFMDNDGKNVKEHLPMEEKCSQTVQSDNPIVNAAFLSEADKNSIYSGKNSWQ